MTQANNPNSEAIAYAKAAFAAHPGNVGKALRDLVERLDARDGDPLAYDNLVFKEQAVKAFEGILARYEDLMNERDHIEQSISHNSDRWQAGQMRIARIDTELSELVASADNPSHTLDLDLGQHLDLAGEAVEPAEEIEQEEDYDEVFGEYDGVEEDEYDENFTVGAFESPMTELLTLTKIGELRQALIAGIVCLTDTDNEGEVRHQFLTANQGFISHLVGQRVPLRENSTTVFHAFDLIHQVPAEIQPDMFTGTAHLVANFVTPVDLVASRDGHLVLDAKAGALFISSLPAELPSFAVAVTAIGGLNEEGRLVGVYPYRPVTPEVTCEAPSNSL